MQPFISVSVSYTLEVIITYHNWSARKRFLFYLLCWFDEGIIFPRYHAS